MASGFESVASSLAQVAEAIAKLAEREPIEATLEEAVPPDIEDMTKPQLVAYAADKGIDISAAKSKPEILATIQAAETAQA
jgi:hypothetical protein